MASLNGVKKQLLGGSHHSLFQRTRTEYTAPEQNIQQIYIYVLYILLLSHLHSCNNPILCAPDWDLLSRLDNQDITSIEDHSGTKILPGHRKKLLLASRQIGTVSAA